MSSDFGVDFEEYAQQAKRGEPLVAEYGEQSRTSRGLQSVIIDKTTYQMTKSSIEKAMLEIQKIISEYKQPHYGINHEYLYSFEESIPLLGEGVEFYNPTLLLISFVYIKIYSSEVKRSLKEIIDKFEYTGYVEDVIRYIRFWKSILGEAKVSRKITKDVSSDVEESLSE